MRPMNKLSLLALISFFLFGTVPAIHAQTAATAFSGTLTGTVICADPPQSYDGTISQLGQIDYWEIKLAAGQKLIIDVDAEKIDSSLDAYLVVLDKDENIVGMHNDEADGTGRIISLDPYLEVVALSEDYYYIGISSAATEPSNDEADPLNDPTIGDYTFTVQCSAQPTTSEFTLPVPVGDLLGATGSKPGSLVNITPENASSSLPFPLGVGPIVDIEFDPSSELIFVAVDTTVAIDDAVAVDAAVAVDYIPAKIVVLDPTSGNEVGSYSLGTESVVALEAAGNELYGVRVDPVSEGYSLVLVTLDDSDPTAPTATLAHVAPLVEAVYALAYHSVEKVMYGVVAGAAGSSGSELVQIDLTSGAFVPLGDPGAGVIVTLDFSNDNFLFGVDLSGNLHEIDLTTGLARLIGEIDTSAKVSGLTFVVGEPQNDDPIKTICSSTLTSSASASSASATPKLSRFKLTKNPLHRAVGLFKFQGRAGETVTINLRSEEEESVETAGEESSVSELISRWRTYWRGKGRVFLGVRDAIPNVDFRKRKKDTLPLNISATLPADGTYYVMVIRPLLRFYQTDYCVTLESDIMDSVAWETFDVAWPSDDSEDDTASTSAAEPEAVQKSTETVASASADDGPVPVALSTTALEPTAAPPDESAAGGDDIAVVQTGGDETPLVESVIETPVVAEPAADEVGGTESGDDTVDDGYSDDPMEDPLPMKG